MWNSTKSSIFGVGRSSFKREPSNNLFVFRPLWKCFQFWQNSNTAWQIAEMLNFWGKLRGKKLNSPGLDGKILREYLCDLFSLTISAKDMEEYMNIGKNFNNKRGQRFENYSRPKHFSMGIVQRKTTSVYFLCFSIFRALLSLNVSLLITVLQ